MHVHPRAEKKMGEGKFIGESCKCTPGRARVHLLRKFGRSGRREWLYLSSLACVLKATTKTVVNFFGEEKCTFHQRKSWLHLLCFSWRGVPTTCIINLGKISDN